MKQFWEFKAAANQGALFLYGEISDVSWLGDEITPAQFQKDLAALGKIDTLDVYINSPGGDVFAGITIYNILKRHSATVNVHIDGIAASSASIIAMAGDRIVMPKAATMMIHSAWAIGMGNKTDLRKLSDTLERVDVQIAAVYADRTGQKQETISLWMEEEHWMSGEEAQAEGFADDVEENKRIAACADIDKYMARYKHPPDGLKIEQNSEAASEGGFLVPDNGEEAPQPAADKSRPDALNEQRHYFDQIRKKLLEV